MSDGPGLFLIYIGGRAGNANIELHDVRFVAGNSIEDTYDALREQWFGDPKSLHLDSYLRVTNVDGYEVQLRRESPAQDEKLFFINLGGYDPRDLAELHAFGLFVATSSGQAKTRAKQTLLVGADTQHKDDLYEVDDCLQLDSIEEYYVHLVRGGTKQEQKPDWFGYKPIGK